MGNKIEPVIKTIGTPPTKGKKGTQGFTWEIYIIAFVITVIIFIIGVVIGTHISKSEIADIKEKIAVLSDRTLSLQLMLISTPDPTVFCSMYEGADKAFEEEAWALGEQLDYLELQKGVTDDELKSRYSELEFRNYYFTNLAKERCNLSTVTILYFYSNDKRKCQRCFEQGVELFNARRQMLEAEQAVRIYSFDGDLDTPIINILKEKFEIDSYPTIIINEQIYPKFMSAAEVINVSLGYAQQK